MVQEDTPIVLQDESGDHRYFTIIPNYVLNHSTDKAQALYGQLKRFAGEKGKAYPSQKTLMRLLGISKNTLKKELSYLLDKGWIEDAGFVEIKTPGGKQKVQAYTMVDLWQLNTEYYAKGGQNSIPLEPKGGQNSAPKGGQNMPPNKINNSKEDKDSVDEQARSTVDTSVSHETTESKPVVSRSFFHPKQKDGGAAMTLSDFVLMCRGDHFRHVRLIGEYADERKFAFTTRGQWREFGIRNMRVAKRLSPYTDRQLSEAIRRLEKDLNAKPDFKFKWGLETVEKYLEEALAKK